MVSPNAPAGPRDEGGRRTSAEKGDPSRFRLPFAKPSVASSHRNAPPCPTSEDPCLAQHASARFALTRSDPNAQLDSFADAVAQPDSATSPKTLPCRFLYDAAGSEIFEEICELPEYYLTRAEREVLEHHADDIAQQFEQDVILAELGSGSSTKTRLLIEAFLRRQPKLRYVPVDISPTMLRGLRAGFARRLPPPRDPRDRQRVPGRPAPRASRDGAGQGDRLARLERGQLRP